MNTDMIHPAGMEKEWSESFYFNVYDKANDVCVFMRIGLKPNMDERSAFCFIMMPDGPVVGIKDQETYGRGTLDAKGLHFEVVEPEKRWKMTYGGHMACMTDKGPVPVPVSFNLAFEARNEVFDYRECVDAAGERISGQVASEHLEQFGRITGSLMVGEEQLDLSGLGERDHSWGVRDWNAPKMWIWLTAQFSDHVALNVTKLFVDQGEVSAGYFHLNGKNLPLVKAEVRTVLDPDGTPRSLAMSLVDKFGAKHKVTAEVLRLVAMPFPSRDGKSVSVMHETLAEYTFNGQKGYGIAEYLVRKE
ncbi:MAG: hypothetical protein SA339_06810 [Methanomassiliicoccus sp.]|nr:hypothetical protein [Methanomassiliicoccus sp.]